MLSPEELLKVATTYAEATGLSLVTVGRAACNGNDKIFPRIRQGGGATSRSIEAATLWFEANWPDDAHWPEGVIRRNAAPPPRSRARLRGAPAPQS